ncbi:hypothetical protein Egran_04490 [Elaphomyces granulatus]|uniref:Peptidase A1 domain-containing protein n=1 Tax=Elaphomyces granulatus TaxID=519963 RepID=A0A232LUB7_9EURO|nr:hypothetical protein Egran_04490 [Elaphomyces granulatus]
MTSRINLIANPFYKGNGTKSYVHLLRKYGFNPTKEGPFFHGGSTATRRVLLKKRGSEVGEVEAEDVQNDSMYLAPVKIGTPSQTVELDFDTGSSDLWVWSTELPSSILHGPGSHSIFDSSKSSTFHESPSLTWRISYGDSSSASGNVGTDVVNVGGLVIEDQAVELATSMSRSFVSNAGDGLLGLAFGKINTVKPERVKTLVENMIIQEDIPKSAELFTVYLTSSKDLEQSFYTFGFIDDAIVRDSGQEISYAPVDNGSGFWMFDSTSATINGNPIHRLGNKAIADTGTTLALVDDKTCNAIYSAVPGATYDSGSQGYIFPNDLNPQDLPTITFAVGDRQFPVRKSDLGFAEARPGYVFGGIQSRGDLSFDILGDTFLKAIYAIFDVGNLRFGAVEKNISGLSHDLKSELK